MKVLHLTLTAIPFYIMLARKKKTEYRRPSKWMQSRLEGEDKNYTHVKFTNGYGSDKPYFIAEFKGFQYAQTNYRKTFEHDDFYITVHVWYGDFRIRLGKIIETGNIKPNNEAINAQNKQIKPRKIANTPTHSGGFFAIGGQKQAKNDCFIRKNR